MGGKRGQVVARAVPTVAAPTAAAAAGPRRPWSSRRRAKEATGGGDSDSEAWGQEDKFDAEPFVTQAQHEELEAAFQG